MSQNCPENEIKGFANLIRLMLTGPQFQYAIQQNRLRVVDTAYISSSDDRDVVKQTILAVVCKKQYRLW